MTRFPTGFLDSTQLIEGQAAAAPPDAAATLAAAATEAAAATAATAAAATAAAAAPTAAAAAAAKAAEASVAALGLDPSFTDSSAAFVKDYHDAKTKKNSCDFWSQPAALNDTAMHNRILTMRRGDIQSEENNSEQWRGHLHSDLGTTGPEVTSMIDNTGDAYTVPRASDVLAERGGALGGAVGGYDYAICGEAHDNEVHGKGRVLRDGEGASNASTDVPIKPFIGDCVGLNKEEFDTVVPGCKTPQQLSTDGEHIVCPPGVFNGEKRQCKSISCPGEGESEKLKFELMSCKETQAGIIRNMIYVPAENSATGGWSCMGEIGEVGEDLDQCPSPARIQKYFDIMFSKSAKGTKEGENIKWDKVTYSDRKNVYNHNFAPCYNFGESGGGDETMKAETGDDTGGEGIFHDKLHEQNERNAATYGWYDMKGNGFVREGEEWVQQGNSRFEEQDLVWVLLIPHTEIAAGKSREINARWLQGEITSRSSPGKYSVTLHPRDQMKHENYEARRTAYPWHSLSSRRPIPAGDKNNDATPATDTLSGVDWRRLRRRSKFSGDISTASALDQIWLKSVCGKDGSNVGRGGPTKVPVASLGCFRGERDDGKSTDSYSCYTNEKALSRIPSLLQYRKLYGKSREGCRLAPLGNIHDRWIDWCHKYKAMAKRPPATDKKGASVISHANNFVNGNVSNVRYKDFNRNGCQRLTMCGDRWCDMNINTSRDNWASWGGVYPHTTPNPDKLGQWSGHGWAWAEGNGFKPWNADGARPPKPHAVYFHTQSPISLMGRHTEGTMIDEGVVLDESGWRTRNKADWKDINEGEQPWDKGNPGMIAARKAGRNKNTGLTSCTNKLVGDGGKFPLLSRNKLVFDSRHTSNTLYPSQLSDTTGITVPSRTGEKKEVGQGGMYRACMRSSDDFNAKNLLTCCLTGKPLSASKIGARNVTGFSCPMNYCHGTVPVDALTGAQKKAATDGNGCGSASGAMVGGKQICSVMSEKCFTSGKEICSSNDIEFDDELDRLCRQWGNVQPLVSVPAQTKRCLWLSDVRNSDRNKIDKIDDDTLMKDVEKPLTNLYKTLGKGSICRDAIRKSLSSGLHKSNLDDFCKDAVRKGYGKCVAIPGGQCRAIDPSNSKHSWRCKSVESGEQTLESACNETLGDNQKICTYTKEPSPVPQTCKLKTGIEDVEKKKETICREKNGLGQKVCEGLTDCEYTEPETGVSNIHETCKNQKDDPQECQSNMNCEWTNTDESGKPMNARSPGSKAYWEKTLKGSLLSKKIINKDHLSKANKINISGKPDSLDGFGFDLCSCHYGKEYNDWYKENKIQGISKGEGGKMLVGQPHHCWLEECTNGGWFVAGSDISNKCSNVFNCIQNQVTNIYNKGGGLQRQAAQKGGSQSCSYQASNTSIQTGGGGAGTSSATGKATAAAIQSVSDTINLQAGLPQSETSKQLASEELENDNTMMMFGAGGVSCLCLIIIVVIIFLMKNKSSAAQ